jgi:hypothetical protein
MTVRAINFNEESSGFSNEVSTTAQSGSELTLSFNEPNLQMDGNCLTSQISRYVVHYGSDSGSYTTEVSVDRDSSALTCTTIGTHPSCGDITNCSTQITI